MSNEETKDVTETPGTQVPAGSVMPGVNVETGEKVAPEGETPEVTETPVAPVEEVAPEVTPEATPEVPAADTNEAVDSEDPMVPVGQ